MKEYTMPKLIMLTGLQGTGKSTLARHLTEKLNVPLFSKDAFESILFNEGLTDGTSISSYHLLLATTDQQLSYGMSVIADAVFPLVGFRQQMGEIAHRNGAQLYVLHTFCSDETLHRQRLETRVSSVPWARITWDDVQYTASHYQAWHPDSALFLDAINPLETNLNKSLQYIDNYS